MKRLADYLDPEGFVGHFTDDTLTELEFGDGALRLGQHDISNFLLAKSADERGFVRYGYLSRVQKLLSGSEPVRYPDDLEWWGQSGTMSRDNLYGLIDGATIMGAFLVNRLIWKKLKRRWFFTWNTKDIWSTKLKKIPIPDWTGPETWRRLNPFWPYSLRLLCDLVTLLTLPARLLTLKINPNHTSPEPIFVMGILNRRTSPTIASTLVEKIYLKFQPWERALIEYFQDPKAPPLGDLLIQAVKSGN